MKKVKNPCVRCGRERIVSRVWKEKIENSVIVNIENVCPDPECQKKVNESNKKQHDKYIATTLRNKERLTSRRKLKK